jgi:hypothetical protein
MAHLKSLYTLDVLTECLDVYVALDKVLSAANGFLSCRSLTMSSNISSRW